MPVPVNNVFAWLRVRLAATTVLKPAAAVAPKLAFRLTVEVVPSPIVQVEPVPTVIVEGDAPDEKPFPFKVSVFIDSVVGRLVKVWAITPIVVVLSAKNLSSFAGAETYWVLLDQFPAVVQDCAPVVVFVQV